MSSLAFASAILGCELEKHQLNRDFPMTSNVDHAPVTAVVFDIGNVLVGWEPEAMYDRVIGPDRRRKLFASVDLDTMNISMDRGAPFKETVHQTAAAHPEFTDDILLWHDRWIEMFTPVLHHSVHLLHTLRRKGVPVFALSNFGKETIRIADQSMPFLLDFDMRFISGELECLKPEPEIYAIVERECGHAPEGLLFADDRPENIRAAQERGWHGHLFESSEGFAACLVSHGILDESEAFPEGSGS